MHEEIWETLQRIERQLSACERAIADLELRLDDAEESIEEARSAEISPPAHTLAREARP